MGARDVVPAVEMAVRFMKVGETALVWSHSKYAYGLAGRTYQKKKNGKNDSDGDSEEVYKLPPQSNVAYEVTVLRKVDEDESSTSDTMSVQTLIELTKARKEQANDMYVNEWYSGAGKSRVKQAYERIVKDMESFLGQIEQEGGNESSSIPADVQTTAQTLRIDALNNITAVLLRAKDFHAAKVAAVKVLELDPNNYKALIRAAKAALMDPSSEFEEVEMALEAAAAQSNEDGINEDMEKLKQDFLRRKQAYEMTSKKMFKSAFDGKKKNGDDTDQATAAASKPTPAASVVVNTESSDTKKGNVTAGATTTKFTDWGALLWNYILPYGFQIMLPFIMWHLAQKYRRHSPDDVGSGVDDSGEALIQDEF